MFDEGPDIFECPLKNPATVIVRHTFDLAGQVLGEVLGGVPGGLSVGVEFGDVAVMGLDGVGGGRGRDDDLSRVNTSRARSHFLAAT